MIYPQTCFRVSRMPADPDLDPKHIRWHSRRSRRTLYFAALPQFVPRDYVRLGAFKITEKNLEVGETA
jgi:hypothetical protein